MENKEIDGALKCEICDMLVLSTYELKNDISSISGMDFVKAIYKSCDICGHLELLEPKQVVEFLQKVEEYKTCLTCSYSLKGFCARDVANMNGYAEPYLPARCPTSACPFWENIITRLK
jgi:hypothetical protein